mmetsp:Transcript_40347/g.73016  ORF Transcript_40347/g.73016 Transcript_40347/m.73016 type:complete len:175 (+) Transcript_40347:44-568(+)
MLLELAAAFAAGAAAVGVPGAAVFTKLAQRLERVATRLETAPVEGKGCPAKAKSSATASDTASPSLAQAGPPVGDAEDIQIQYCVGCRWMLRAAWMAQELLSTFASSTDSAPPFRGITLVPDSSKPGGVFRVSVGGKVLWDRKENGGFPESKVLKQLVRDHLSPDKDLGHSDKK